MNETVLGTKYTREQFMNIIKTGGCPFCGKTGYKIPLQHIAKIHGINHAIIKDELLTKRGKGFCNEETKRLLSDAALKNGLGTAVNIFKGKRVENRSHDDISIKKMKLKASTDEHMNSFFNNVAYNKESQAKSKKTRVENYKEMKEVYKKYKSTKEAL